MDHDAEVREQKAFRRLTAAARTLAKGSGNVGLVDEISSAYHMDANVRNMRRTEAIAAFLEAMVSGGTVEETTTTTKGAKGTKAEATAAAE